MKSFVLTALTLVAVIHQALCMPVIRAQEQSVREHLELRDGDRVVLLGGTFFERAQRYGWLETALQMRCPDRKVAFRNLGWSGDTVLAESRGIFDAPAQGYTRMITQIRELKPTVILINYGSVESFQGEPGLAPFLQQYGRLLDDLTSTGARLVLVSHPPFLTLPAPLPDMREANQRQALYRDAIRELAAKRSLLFVDLLEAFQPGRTPATDLSDNGLHLTDAGYRLIADQFANALLGPALPRRLQLSATGKTDAATGVTVQNVSATTKDSLTVNLTLPLQLDAPLTLQASGLPAGNYSIRVDGQELQKAGHSLLAQGVALSLPSEQQRITLLRQKLMERDLAYFHRWRPQNVTYLFLFRKHEQGQNAKDVDEFEAIVNKLDEGIPAFKQPPTLTLEIAPLSN